MAVLECPELGLTHCLQTFTISRDERAARQAHASRQNYLYDARPTGKDIEPADLARKRADLELRVGHVLLGLQLPSPKLKRTSERTVPLVYERRLGRNAPLCVNELPLADLLCDAAECPFFSIGERSALVALVTASQCIVSVPHLFEAPARAAFFDPSRTSNDINMSVLLRGFISGCAQTAEEIGLAYLFLQRAASPSGHLCSFKGARLDDFFVEPEQMAAASSILDVLLAAMEDVYSAIVVALRDRIAYHWPTGRQKPCWTPGSGSSVPREPPSSRLIPFLEAQFMAAAKRVHPGCQAFVVDVALAPGQSRASTASGCGADVGTCRAEVAEQQADFEQQRSRAVRGEAARESRSPHYYELLPHGGEIGGGRKGLHIRLAARPLWTYYAAGAWGMRSAEHDYFTSASDGQAPQRMRRVGSLAYLRRRVIVDRDDVCFLEGNFFLPARSCQTPVPGSTVPFRSPLPPQSPLPRPAVANAVPVPRPPPSASALDHAIYAGSLRPGQPASANRQFRASKTPQDQDFTNDELISCKGILIDRAHRRWPKLSQRAWRHMAPRWRTVQIQLQPPLFTSTVSVMGKSYGGTERHGSAKLAEGVAARAAVWALATLD